MILPTDYYRYNAEKDIWEDMREDETYMKNVVDNGTQIQVCGIIRQKEDAVNTAIRSGVGYTKELMQYLMQGVNDSEVAKAQLADETTDIFTGIPFDNDKDTPIQWMMSMHMLQRFQSRNGTDAGLHEPDDRRTDFAAVFAVFKGTDNRSHI